MLAERGYSGRLGDNMPADGWSASGALFTGADPNSQNVHLQVNFTESGVYTVEFNVSPAVGTSTNPDVTTAVQSQTQAIVDWTVEGNTVTRLFDVGNGVAISGVAKGVRVRAFDNSGNLIAAGSIAAGLKYGVSILVARGIRPNIETPVTLDGTLITGDTLVTLDPSGGPSPSATFPIPANAGAISVEVFSDGSNVLIQQFADSNGVNAVRSYSYSDPKFVPLAVGVTSVKLTNQDSIDSADVAVTFGIQG